MMPSQIDVNVAATNTFAVQLAGNVKVEVPIDQNIEVPLEGNYKTRIKSDTPIPIKFNVHYKGTAFQSKQWQKSMTPPHWYCHICPSYH